MYIKRIAALLLSVTASCSHASDKEYFMLGFFSCKLAVASMSLAKQPFLIQDGAPMLFTCERGARKVKCVLTLNADSEAPEEKVVEYETLFYSDPFFNFGFENGADYISINTKTKAAVANTRIAGETVAGSKICHGLYTEDLDRAKAEAQSYKQEVPAPLDLRKEAERRITEKRAREQAKSK